jgi:hypothetical protein
MAFAAALGLAGSAIGAVSGIIGANSQARAAMYDAQQRRLTEIDQTNLARQQMGYGYDAMQREYQMAEYIKALNERNAGYALDERTYGRNITESQQARAIADALYDRDRVGQMDTRTAAEYERRRQEINNNKLLTGNERQRALQELERAQQIALSERNFDINRLNTDTATRQSEREQALQLLLQNRDQAQTERGFDIDQLRLNQRLRGGERQVALEQLQREQALLAGERNQDFANFNDARAQRQAERDFQVSEYRNDRSIAAGERQDDIASRALARSATDRMSSALEQALASLGPMQETRLLGEADINAEAARREGTAVSDIDRLATRVASVNEGNLIRKGIDSSTTGDLSRAAITAQIAPEYAKARDAARSEAVRYVSGINDNLKLAPELERLRREQTLRDIQSAFQPTVQAYSNQPNVRSALAGGDFNNIDSAAYDRSISSAAGARGPLDVNSAVYTQDVASASNYRGPLDVNSGVLDRTIGSANDYRGPLDVNSAVYGNSTDDLGFGMANQLASRTQNIAPYNGSATYNYAQPNLPSGSSILSGSNSIFNGVMSSRANSADRSMDRASLASGAAGAAVGDFFTRGGSFLDDLFKKKTPSFSSSSSGFMGDLG